MLNGIAGGPTPEQNGEHSPGLLVVVSAPSGTGKTSVLREVLRRHADVRFSVSATTRAPRAGERDGVDYYFVSEDEFERLVVRGEFVEWAVVHGCRYGTLKRTVAECAARGETVVFDTDTVGARNIRASFPEAVLIFIAPPSPEALRIRLESRDTETPERVRMRLAAAPGEMERAGEYDYIVVNDTLEEAVERVEAILCAERLRSARMLSALVTWFGEQGGRD